MHGGLQELPAAPLCDHFMAQVDHPVGGCIEPEQ